MAWVKGQSGNAKGHSRRGSMLARLARNKTQDGLELVEFALSVLRGETKEKGVRVVKEADGSKTTVEVDLPPSLEDRMEAMKWLADRGWGKAVETVEIHDDEPAADPVPEADLEAGLGPEGTMQ